MTLTVYITIRFSIAGKNLQPEGEGGFDPILDFGLRLRCLVVLFQSTELRFNIQWRRSAESPLRYPEGAGAETGASSKPPRFHTVFLRSRGLCYKSIQPMAPGSPQRRVKVTRDYQRLPKITQNEILKVSRLPGEGGKLHPATQNGLRDKIQMSKNGHACRAINHARRRQGSASGTAVRRQTSPRQAC